MFIPNMNLAAFQNYYFSFEQTSFLQTNFIPNHFLFFFYPIYNILKKNTLPGTKS